MLNTQTTPDASATVWTPASTSRRAGFGTYFPRRPTAHNVNQISLAVSVPCSGTTQDRLNFSSNLFSQEGLFEPRLSSSLSSSEVSSPNSALPLSYESSPSATFCHDAVNEQRLLPQQIMQLSSRTAICVRQNRQVISLLKRLVALSENIAIRRNGGSGCRASLSTPVSPTTRLPEVRSSAMVPAASKAEQSYALRYMMDEVTSIQPYGTSTLGPDVTLDTSYHTPVSFGELPTASNVVQYAAELQGTMVPSCYQGTAPTSTDDNSPNDNVSSGAPCKSSMSSTYSAADIIGQHTDVASTMSASKTPASLFVMHGSSHGQFSERSSLCESDNVQESCSITSSVDFNDPITFLSEDGQQPKKRKRSEVDGEIAQHGREIRATAEDTNSSTKDDVGPWQSWVIPRQHAPSLLAALPKSKYRTLREVRAVMKASSSRPSGAVGRIPLKVYLEVSGPDECRAVRRLGRKLYTAWLEPNTRFGKQDSARLLACVHRLEYTFPVLADCDEHWKARQVMLQIIDNAIDEHKSTERRTTPTSITNGSPSRQRGRPKGTTAAAMAMRRQSDTFPLL